MTAIASAQSAVAPSRRFWAVPLVVLLALVPALTSNPYYLSLFAMVFIYYLVMVSNNVLMGYAGQFSLAAVALFAVAAYTTAILTTTYGVSFWVAAGIAIVLVSAMGLLTTLPALRLTFLHLAILSVMLVLVVSEMVLSFPSLTGGWDGISGIPAPRLGSMAFTPVWQYWLGLALAVFWMWLERNLVSSQHGRRFLLMADNEVASESVGIPTVRTKAVAFVVSSVPLGVAGALFASFNGYVSEGTFNFDLVMLFIIAMVIGGFGNTWGPAIGAVVIVGLPLALNPIMNWRLLIFGAVLLAIMWVLPDGVTAGVETLIAKRRARQGRQTLPPAETLPASSADRSSYRVRAELAGPLLGAKDLTKAFGGLRAVDRVSFEIKPGLCYGVIGPNGSGKTTLLNLISCYYRANSGTLLIRGKQANSLSAHAAARLGIARTFQIPFVCARMTVLENVMVGHSMFGKSSITEALLTLPRHRRDEREAQKMATWALSLVGMADKAHRKAGSLTHAELRMTELARALMLEPCLLLLDEPASGLDTEQMEKLLDIIRSVRATGTTVLLVEHNVGLVSRIADSLIVLDYGQVIAEGAPDVVLADTKVGEVYLGATSGLTGNSRGG